MVRRGPPALMATSTNAGGHPVRFPPIPRSPPETRIRPHGLLRHPDGSAVIRRLQDVILRRKARFTDGMPQAGKSANFGKSSPRPNAYTTEDRRAADTPRQRRMLSRQSWPPPAGRCARRSSEVTSGGEARRSRLARREAATPAVCHPTQRPKSPRAPGGGHRQSACFRSTRKPSVCFGGSIWPGR